MLKRRNPSMGPCGTLIMVCYHELKPSQVSFFGVYLKGSFLLVLDYHNLRNKHVVQSLLNHGADSQTTCRGP